MLRRWVEEEDSDALGIDPSVVEQYIKFVADSLLEQLGKPKMYNFGNPLPADLETAAAGGYHPRAERQQSDGLRLGGGNGSQWQTRWDGEPRGGSTIYMRLSITELIGGRRPRQAALPAGRRSHAPRHPLGLDRLESRIAAASQSHRRRLSEHSARVQLSDRPVVHYHATDPATGSRVELRRAQSLRRSCSLAIRTPTQWMCIRPGPTLSPNWTLLHLLALFALHPLVLLLLVLREF